MDIILTLLALFPSLLQSAGGSSSSQACNDHVIEIQLEDDTLKMKEFDMESYQVVGLV